MDEEVSEKSWKDLPEHVTENTRIIDQLILLTTLMDDTGAIFPTEGRHQSVITICQAALLLIRSTAENLYNQLFSALKISII